jgi:glycine/D-amino acid oxidase-like deaminating enzyme
MSTERVVIVGGGVIGTMHALEACRRGWEVVHLETDAGPRRASARNFGLVWVSGRAAGPELDLALRARQRWEEIGRDSSDVGFRPDGSLTMATDAAELALMNEAASQPDADSRSFELLDAAGIRSINPAIRSEQVGGLLCQSDAVVEPGSVLAAIRHTLDATGRYRWLPSHQVVDVVPGPGGSGGSAVVDRQSSIISVAAIRAHSCSCALAIGSRALGAASERHWRRRRCGGVASR